MEESNKRIKLEEFKLPLRNKNKEIIGYTLVNEDVYKKYENSKMHMVHGYVRNTHGRLHRLIMNAKKGETVDHINGDKLDNRRENLRIVSKSENARNRKKVNGSTSNYYGVCWDNKLLKWRAGFVKNGITKAYRFTEEIHAAYWYDVLVEKHDLKGSKLNNVPKPDNFIEPTDRIPRNGVRFVKSGRFLTRIYRNGKQYHIGVFDLKMDAEAAYKNAVLEFEKQDDEKRLASPIKRNQDGIAIIEIFNRKKEKVADVLVDDNKYYDLIKYSWSLGPRGYVCGNINNKSVRMSRYLMNAGIDDPFVDHINRNIFDNRMANLRFATIGENAHNKSKHKNASSQYFGVSIDRTHGVFKANIAKDKKSYCIGTFKDEIEAAKAYDIKAKELYGDKARLNFPL